MVAPVAPRSSNSHSRLSYFVYVAVYGTASTSAKALCTSLVIVVKRKKLLLSRLVRKCSVLMARTLARAQSGARFWISALMRGTKMIQAHLLCKTVGADGKSSSSERYLGLELHLDFPRFQQVLRNVLAVFMFLRPLPQGNRTLIFLFR